MFRDAIQYDKVGMAALMKEWIEMVLSASREKKQELNPVRPGWVRSYDLKSPYQPVSEHIQQRWSELYTRIIREERRYCSGPWGQNGYHYTEFVEVNPLLRLEFRWVVGVILAHRLPIQIESNDFGFNSFLLTVYNHRYVAQPNGERKLEVLLRFGDEQIPVYPGPKKETGEDRLRRSYAELLKYLKPDKEFRRMLRFYGFEDLPNDATKWLY